MPVLETKKIERMLKPLGKNIETERLDDEVVYGLGDDENLNTSRQQKLDTEFNSAPDKLEDDE
jgi:hypothetical protein